MRQALLVLFSLPAFGQAGATLENWGVMKLPEIKSLYFSGWYAGFSMGIMVAQNANRSNLKSSVTEFEKCLDAMSTKQKIAIIDKHYKETPQRWNNLLSAEILVAFGKKGGPCEGKSALMAH